MSTVKGDDCRGHTGTYGETAPVYSENGSARKTKPRLTSYRPSGTKKRMSIHIPDCHLLPFPTECTGYAIPSHPPMSLLHAGCCPVDTGTLWPNTLTHGRSDSARWATTSLSSWRRRMLTCRCCGEAFPFIRCPDCLLIVYPYTLAESSSLAWA